MIDAQVVRLLGKVAETGLGTLQAGANPSVILPAALEKPNETLRNSFKSQDLFERKFQSTSAIQINRSILVPSYKYLMGYSELKNTRLPKPKRSSS